MHWSCMVYISAAAIVGFVWGVVLTMATALFFKPGEPYMKG
mgnify:CR=1 FL=1